MFAILIKFLLIFVQKEVTVLQVISMGFQRFRHVIKLKSIDQFQIVF